MPNPKIKLTIEKNVFGGEGLAHWNGKACFVEGALSGETVEAELVREGKDWSRARATRVLEASPARIEPRCRYYRRCGGCQYQHVSYAEELRLKEAQFHELLEPVPGARGRIRPALHGGRDYRYRHSAALQVDRSEKIPRWAFVSTDNVSPVPVESCDLLDERLEAVLKKPLPSKIKPGKVHFKLSHDGKIVSDEKENFFRIRLLDRELIAHSQGFIQNNPDVTGLVGSLVRGWVERLKPAAFFDLYAGIGTFTFLCAPDVPKLVCVEESRHAFAALKMNREELGRKDLRAEEGRVERVFPELWRSEGAQDSVVLMDPPRQGVEAGLARFLASEVAARAIVYISCDPSTLARDLKLLTGSGRWRLEELVPFDMFPRTKHLEAAALLYYNEGA